MADLDPPMIAVVCLVDSSTSLAAEWSRILAEYISPLFKRLSELYPGYQFRVGLVVYATAATRPTPVLSRRFFSPMQPFIQELRDKAADLGIGRTWDGGGEGMAVLEGFVAAAEMFDDLRSSLSKDSIIQSSSSGGSSVANFPICHIFHVAASPPDDAQHPLWNGATLFDDVTWDTLPSELKKRNIHLSIINLREFNQFSDLHSSVALGSIQQPWFNVRPPNHLLLSDFQSSQQRTIKAEELSAEKDGEAKRFRQVQSPSKRSPTIANTGVSQRPLSSATNAVSPRLNPSLQQSSTVSRPPAASFPQQQQILERLRAAEMQLRRMDEAIKNAISSGDAQAADHLKQARDRNFTAYVNFKSMIASHSHQSQARAPASVTQDASNGGPSVPQAVISSSTQLPSLDPIHLTGNVISASDVQAAPKLTHTTTSSSFSPVPNVSQNLPSHNMQTTTGVSLQMVPQLQAVEQQWSRQAPFQESEQGASTNASGELPKPTAGHTIWQGVLAWTGSDPATQGRKEMHCQVFASRQSDGASHTETWPSVLMLTPSRGPTVSLQDMQVWMRRHKPVLCAFQPQAQGPDLQANEIHYRSLVQLLMSRNIYALAAWSLPSGVSQNNLIVFPVHGCGLAGAFFPLTGIPELPKPSAGSINVPPAFAAQIQKLAPELRNQFLNKIMRQKQLLQLQQQQQQKPETLIAGSSQQFNIVPQPGVPIMSTIQPTTHTATQSESGVGNVSYEIMQSFMQRSVEGSDPGLGSGA